MSECCGPSTSCCGGEEYRYLPQPFEDGSVDTFAGPIPRITTRLTGADRRGTIRMRLGAGRDDYRVRPGLYAIGDPDDRAPVLVTANYKLTVDRVRANLTGRDVWLLVLDTRGVNVWCAAGKGTFGTEELVRRIKDVRLEQIVSHTRLVVPQLGATGVAGHEVRASSGFSVTWGPVRAEDLGAFLDAGMKATPEMRRVTFHTRERAALIGVELSVLWRWQVLAAVALFVALAVAGVLGGPALAVAAAGVLGVIAGAALMPVLLPWIPGRAFALKGALAGLGLGGLVLLAGFGTSVPLYAWGLLAVLVAIASYVGMNFTGSSTFTSPSGVEWEMRRAIPVQVSMTVVGIGALIVGLVVG